MFKKNKWNFGLWAGLLAGLVFVAPLWGGDSKKPADSLKLPEVVARINGVDINAQFIKFKINNILNRIKLQNGGASQKLSRIQKIEIARDVIDKEVIRRLMYQVAKAANKKMPTALLEKEMAGLVKTMGGEEKFKKNLKGRDVKRETIRRDIEMEYLIRDLIKEQIEGKIHVADEEVKSFYEANIDKFKRPKAYHTRHILIPHFGKEDLRSVGKDDMGKKQKELSKRSKKKAEKILADIRGGADFGAMAKKYSKDQESAKNGGDLDFMYKGIYPPNFDEAVVKLKLKEISDVVETVAGYHIIQLIETRPPDTAPFADVKEGIQKFIFMKSGKIKLEKYVKRLRKQAKVEVLY